jgi:hypothetical protein
MAFEERIRLDKCSRRRFHQILEKYPTIVLDVQLQFAAKGVKVNLEHSNKPMYDERNGDYLDTKITE